MTDRELMQQALDALEEINKLSIGENAICLPAEIDTAMDALRERLAQPEQCQYPNCKCATENPCLKGLAQPEQEPVFDCPRCGHCCPPQGIYYTPPQRKPLTDAVLAEREACAAMLDANAMACENPIYRSLLQANAQAIREMGQP